MGNSKSGIAPTHASVDALAVRLMLPVYYSADKLTKEDVLQAKNSWDIIATSSSPCYLFNRSNKTKAEFPFESGTSWFYSVYFSRLFDIHPMSKGMFVDTKAQGRFFQALIGFIFTAVSAQRAFNKRLLLIALSHCRKGVKAVEYGIIGEVMFWSLKVCLGELYDKETHHAWVKLFSSMLAVIIPAAVGYELDSNAAQADRIEIAQKSHAYSFKMPPNAKKDKNGHYVYKLSQRVASHQGIVVVEEVEDLANMHSSATITTWERQHKRQGSTLIDGIDCYS